MIDQGPQTTVDPAQWTQQGRIEGSEAFFSRHFAFAPESSWLSTGLYYVKKVGEQEEIVRVHKAFPITRLAEAAKYCVVEGDRLNADVYFRKTVLAKDPGPGKRGKKEDSWGTCSLWGDIDLKGSNDS